MANEEQLSILKQGVDVWNKWRKENREATIDLEGVNIREAYGNNIRKPDLEKINFHNANLRKADFGGSFLNQAYLFRANLSEADLSTANLANADLSQSNLSLAKLNAANIWGANLSKANLQNAYLVGANFAFANLSDADLGGADLGDAIFTGANLNKANLRRARFLFGYLDKADLREANLAECRIGTTTINATIFGALDLSQAIDLDKVFHGGPSYISTDVFALSKGQIPKSFLRGCGLSDWEIEQVKLYNPDLSNDEISQIQYKTYELRAAQAIQISPLFISYSHGDGTFIDKIEQQLNKKGIRFWRDIHDMKAGRIETQIDKAISQNRTVLLVLSENSIKSDWRRIWDEMSFVPLRWMIAGSPVLGRSGLWNRLWSTTYLISPRGRMMSSLRGCSVS